VPKLPQARSVIPTQRWLQLHANQVDAGCYLRLIRPPAQPRPANRFSPLCVTAVSSILAGPRRITAGQRSRNTEYSVVPLAPGSETFLAAVGGNQTRYDDTTATNTAVTYYYKVTATNARRHLMR